MLTNPQDVMHAKQVAIMGMKVMYDPTTVKYLKAAAAKPGPMPQKLAREVAGVLKLIDDKVGGKIPRHVLVTAGALLLLEVASFLVRTKLGSPTKEDIHNAAHLLTPLIIKTFPKTGGSAPQSGAPQPQSGEQPQPGILGGQ